MRYVQHATGLLVPDRRVRVPRSPRHQRGFLGSGMAFWRKPAGGGGFDPSQNFVASERGLWLDTCDLSTLFQDTGGTIAVTAAGQSVALAKDKSGNANDFSQSGSGNKPPIEQDGFGKYYLDFQPTGGTSATWPHMLIANTNHLYPGTNSIMLVAAAQFYAGHFDNVRGIFARAIAGSTTNGRYALLNDTGTLEALYQDGSTITAGLADSNTTMRILSCYVDRVAGSAVFRINGAQVASTSFTPDASTNLTPALRCILGAYPNSTDTDLFSALFGRIYGVLVRLANVDTTLLANTESWMAARYGVTL